MTGAEALAHLTDAGYVLALDGGEIRASGPTAPSEDLRAVVEKNRETLKAAVLLSNPPAWLSKLFQLWWSGQETPATRSGPSGKAETYMVRVGVREIAAAVAAAIGMDPLDWLAIREEVEEALAARQERGGLSSEWPRNRDRFATRNYG